MNTLLTHPLVKVLAALLICAGCAVLGWWWHQPASLADRTAKAAEQLAPPTLRDAAAAGDDAAEARIRAADPFALKREGGPVAAAVAPGSAASDVIVWRFAAITAQRGEYQLLMTAAEQAPLVLKKGDKLPNGERIRSIQANGVQLQNAAGRTRTIQLIEP